MEDYTEIIEQFNRFWRSYNVDERLFPRRRGATFRLWVNKHPMAREAMLSEVEAKGGPKGKNPYFYVQEFADPEPDWCTGNEKDLDLVQVLYQGRYKICTRETMERFGLEWKRDW